MIYPSPQSYTCVVALVGGGTNPQPGEISLAHNGILFCDELPEFQRSVLEVLRQPLEDRIINISRAKYSTTFPCSFMFVASMNPCPLNCFSIMEGTDTSPVPHRHSCAGRAALYEEYILWGDWMKNITLLSSMY